MQQKRKEPGSLGSGAMSRGGDRARSSVDAAENYRGYAAGAEDLVQRLVEEHVGWARSIAKSVARAWNMDWQLDGLDGGAYEALLFCSRRYDPAMGVPFRAYARKRIHEASTEEARRSRTWQRGVGAQGDADQEARELSARLFDIFPELREGLLPASTEGIDGAEETIRSSLRQLLASANILALFQEGGADNPEVAIEYKRLIELLSTLESVHQSIVWAIYWQGQSMRSLAQEWGIDELSIVREHKEILGYLSHYFQTSRAMPQRRLKIRRGLKSVQLLLKKKKSQPPFSALGMAGFYLLLRAVLLSAGVC